MPTTILNDPLESNTNWTGTSTIVAGRTANCMRVAGSAGYVTYTIAAGSRSAANKIDFWYRPSAIGGGSNRNVAQLRGPSGTAYVTAQHTTSSVFNFILGAAGAVIGTTATAPAVNTWNHVELYCKPGVSGAAIIHGFLNGVELTGSGVTSTPSASPIEVVGLSGNGPTTSLHDFDDFVLTNEIDTANTKIWNGAAFVDASAKVWNGSAFVSAVAVKTWNGSAFV